MKLDGSVQPLEPVRSDCGTADTAARQNILKILFAFENPLPSNAADAEVFTSTARHLAPLTLRAWLHLPVAADGDIDAIRSSLGLDVVRASAPIRPAILRHLCCGLTISRHQAFHDADVVYTRNLFVARMAILFGQRVVFDHYRPWPDQIPPLQGWIHRLMCRQRFVVNICHSDYTREAYLRLGIPAEKLRRVHNGYEPSRVAQPLAIADAKRAIDVPPDATTVVYTGRLNHKKGLDLVIDAARQLPGILFILVGSAGGGPIEMLAAPLANIRIVAWQSPATLSPYIFAADILLIPPSWKPLAEFGSTVLPLKLFLYMASGRPILAGNTPDVAEVLIDGQNALLCAPDNVEALVTAIATLTDDAALRDRLAAQAVRDSRTLTWAARAARIENIVTDRLASGDATAGHWGPTQRRFWLVQSRRWLWHLIRRRSFVLPPDVKAAPSVKAI